MPIQRQQIEGNVMIKRKTAWVTRFASIKDSIFIYKKDRYSIDARYMTDLRKTNVRKGTLEDGKGYFEIKDKTDPKAEVIRISFSDKEEFRKWGLIFIESIKSD
jgi:hypothetical protein